MSKKVMFVHGGAKEKNLTYSQAVKKGNLIFVSGVTGQTDEKWEDGFKGKHESPN